MKKLEKYSNWIMALVFIVVVIVVYKTFDNFYKIAEWLGLILKSLTPFLIGFIIAYILNMPCKKIDALCRKSKYRFINNKSKTISIISVYLIMILAMFIVIRAIAPALYRNAVDLYNNIPGYIDDILAAVETWQSEHNISLFEINEANITKAFNSILGKIDVTEFSKYAKGVVNITSGVINVFIGIIVSVYMLIDKEKIKASVRRILRIFLKEERSSRFIENVKKVNNIFSKYVFCLLLDAIVMAVLATVILSILNIKYAMILGGIIGLFNLIPYFGAIFASVLSVVITLVTGGIFKAVSAAIALIVLQQLDGNFIGPKIMGQMLDASPLWIIFAVTLGGGLFGIGGMIVSVPVLVTLKMVITDFINEKETEKSEN
ncbi:MAG: AI-2E family transporter [Clostridia bacterium]|nr:AI-2E family transporter [Clostridia bacterium]